MIAPTFAEIGTDAGAQDRVMETLAVLRQTGNRVGEAATFFQLGLMAARQGRLDTGMRLIAVCWFIDSAIENVEADSDLSAMLAMTEELQFTGDQIRTMLDEVAEQYRRDRGAALIAAAFGA